MSDVISTAGRPAPERPGALPATAAVQAGAARADQAQAGAAAPSFRDLLSSLNPLQHIPVVGTIYRAITGDTIPEGARMTGSMAFSGLVFGPIGLVTTAAAAAFSKLTGLDTEEIGRDILRGGKPAAPPDGEAPIPADLASASPGAAVPGSGPAEATALAGAGGATRAEAGQAEATQGAEPGRRGLLPAQLAAYGVTRTASGALQRDGMEGADVLNTLELLRIGTPTAVAAAYGGRTPPGAGPAAA